MAAGEHDVLRAADELGVLVEEDEVRCVAVLSRRAAASRPSWRSGCRSSRAAARRRLPFPGYPARPGCIAAGPSGAAAQAPARPGFEFCECRPVGRQEVRLGFRAQDRLAQVERELLVRLDRIVARPVDRDLLGAKAEVDRGRVDDQRAETVADDCDRRVTREKKSASAQAYFCRARISRRTSEPTARQGPLAAWTSPQNSRMFRNRRRACTKLPADERRSGE